MIFQRKLAYIAPIITALALLAFPSSNASYVQPKINQPHVYSSQQIQEKPVKKPLSISRTKKSLEITLNPALVDDTTLLATLIYGEARNCPKLEKIAIAYSVLNRQESPHYETDIKDIIFEPKQYSYFNGQEIKEELTIKLDEYETKKRVWEKCYDVAQGVLSGRYKDPTEGATHYFNPEKASPYWREKLEEVDSIDYSKFHKFYKIPKKEKNKAA